MEPNSHYAASTTDGLWDLVRGWPKTAAVVRRWHGANRSARVAAPHHCG